MILVSTDCEAGCGGGPATAAAKRSKKDTAAETVSKGLALDEKQLTLRGDTGGFTTCSMD
jgi:hypothetical protein